MLSRFTLAVAAAFACAGLAVADPPAPAVIVQIKPVARVLTDVKDLVRQVGGPAEGERMVKEFERGIKQGLGDKGFEGLDINRPIAAYAVLKENPEDAALVILLPVTGEKECLAFLERIQIKTAAVEGKKGVYTLEVPAPLPKDSHIQFTDGGWAYITLNDGEPTPAKDLVPVGDLLKAAGPELVGVKLYPGRVPAKLVTGMLDQLDDAVAGIKGFIAAGPDPASKFAKTYLEQFPKLLRRYTETALKEVEVIAVTVNYDAPRSELVGEMAIVPKAGTATAKEFAAIGPTVNRFAGLVSKGTVVGVTIKAPLFASEVREITVATIELIEAGMKQASVPEKLKPIVEEATKGFIRSVKAGKLDAAMAMVGPDKTGKFVFVAGVSFDDTAALEKAMRDAAKDTTLAGEFEFDAAKVGGVAIHKVPLMKLFPPSAERDLARVLGDKPPAYLAFAKDAIFLTFGAGALDAMKAAVAAKSAPAPAFEVVWNSGRLHKFMQAIEPRAAEEFAKILGTDDKQGSAIRLTVEGGQSLKLKASLDVRYLPKIFLFRMSAGSAPPPPPPPAPPVAIPIKN